MLLPCTHVYIININYSFNGLLGIDRIHIIQLCNVTFIPI